MVTHVAGALGFERLSITATATARAETARVIDCGLVPLGVTPPAGQHAFQLGCGKTYRLGPPSGGAGPGTYGAVVFPECKFGDCHDHVPGSVSTWKCLMANNYCCSIERHQEVATLRRSDLPALVRQAIDGRFDGDTDRRENICYDQYHGNGRRVIFTPITLGQVGGPASVTVTGFAAFFIQGRVRTAEGSALVGQFIHAVAPGSAAPGPVVSGPVTYSVRLVE
jgi:hypothetical protein